MLIFIFLITLIVILPLGLKSWLLTVSLTNGTFAQLSLGFLRISQWLRTF